MTPVRHGKTVDLAAAFKFVLPVMACALAITAGWFIVSYDNPFTTTILLVAAAMVMVVLVNPKAGLYLLILSAGYLDLIKRLGILTGSLSEAHIVITLAVAPILCAFICAGVVIHHIFGKWKLKRWQWGILVIIVSLMTAVLVGDLSRGTGLLEGLRDVANSGAYFPLMLITGILFPKPEDIKRLIKFCLIIYIPVGIYAIWQQIFGLNSFEIDYLKSGFTVTITNLDDIRPRPFSTLNSPHALTVVTAVLAALGFFLHFKGTKREAWQIPVGVLFTLACLASLSRAGWVVFAVAVIGWICFRRAWTTIGFYGITVGFLVLLIVNADRVLHSLDALERKLPGNSALTEEVFRLGTFSDRLYSFRNLMTNPLFHTWFGNPELRAHRTEFSGEDVYAHDQLTQILVSFGFAGLAGFLLLVIGGLWLTHRRVLAQRDFEAREAAIGLLSVLTAVLYSGMLFGSHLGVFPVNVFFALLIGCLAVCCLRPRETAAIALDFQ
jgi:hypothetical protein